MALLAAPLALAACSALPGTTYGLDQLNQATPTGPAFTQALAGEYRAFAGSERDLGEWIPMWHFARKGLQAAQGVALAPDSTGDWSVDDATMKQDLDTQHDRLVALLASPAPARLPALSATAQVKYECWLLHAHEGSPADAIGACHNDFVTAMSAIDAQLRQAQLPVPAAAPVPAPAPAPVVMSPPARAAPAAMRAFFDVNSAALGAEGKRAVEQMVTALKTSSGRVTITGYTDATGKVAANQALSERRANAVAGALVAAGIDKSRITVSGRGASDPTVRGSDGKSEPQNRRVEVQLSP